MFKKKSKIDTERLPDIHSFINDMCVKIVDCQDQAIMRAIRIIGGGKYEEITIDKGKIVDMLERNTPRKVVRGPDHKVGMTVEPHFECPKCSGYMSGYFLRKFCGECGQALDWNLEEA